MLQLARWIRASGAAVALASGGCAGSPPPAPVAAPVVVDDVRVTATDPADLPRLFQEASDMLLRDEYAPAAAAFERIVAVDPTGPTAAPSTYNAALARQGLGELDRAAQLYLESTRLDPQAETTKMALLRASRIRAYLEQWAGLEELARKTLGRSDLTVMEQIETQGALGLALVSLGRVDEAFDVIVKARNQIEDRRLGEAGTPPLELAQVSFALGEIRRLKSEKIVFVPVPSDFGAVLEERCTGLLDAQNAYTEAMRSLDAHWSAMAGFRVGQLYQQLHRDVIQVPPPAEARTLRQKQLWEGAMRLRYRILLEKGLAMMAGTVSLGERTGQQSAWTARAKAAHAELEAALADEKAALSKLPFTEEELRAALDSLKKKTPAP